MKYTLMHKRIAVAELQFDDATGMIEKITAVYKPNHFPIGVLFRNGIPDRGALNEWWADRSIPANRSGVRDALEMLEFSNTKVLLLRCFGLSLSDQYWIRPADSEINWEKVNFFENTFSDDMGDVLFGRCEKRKEFDYNSPDITTDGCLKKRWKIMDGKRCLIKGGSRPSCQQPFNEVIATEIMKRLDIPHVPYSLMWDGNEPYSVCKDFVTEDIELISAWRIMQTSKKSNNVSVYQHFVNCCKELGAPDIVPAIDKMIVVDYLIANEDRHLNNFGLLRNAETLEWIGFAPIFDSGSSFGYDKLASEIRSEHNVTCKPFKKHHAEQITIVSDFSWLDLGKLKDIRSVIEGVFADERARERIGDQRIAAITDSVQARIERLGGIAQSHVCTEQSTDDDVEENIAEDYMPKRI